MSEYYSAFGPYIKKKFGETIYKVNIDAGFTCPNRDGSIAYGGCVYCNNDSFRPSSCKPALTVSEQIEKGISYLSRRYSARKFIAYFQPYTNTYASLDALRKLYSEALSCKNIVGLAIGTRPDAVDEEKINYLEDMAKEYFILIEYGLQSIYAKSLEYINRGHDYKSFLNAVELTGDRGIYIGAHLIAGFPTETREEMLQTADEVSELPIDFLKIHQLQIVKETRLAEIYKSSPFFVFSYNSYLDFLVEFIERLSPGIVLQRVFATAPDDILIAPNWNKRRQEILRDLENKFRQRNSYQGRLYKTNQGTDN